MLGQAGKWASGEVQTLIFGAGPAGLAAAAACRDRNHRFALIDVGPALGGRQRDDPLTVTHGVGGAGLYSDGKFSFYPSATALWRLSDPESLRKAYQWFHGFVRDFALAAPSFPNDQHATASRSDVGAANGSESLKESWLLRKCYRSDYMPLDDRLAMIRSLSDRASPSLLTDCSLKNCTFRDGEWRCDLLIGDSQLQSLRARYIIFAGGRFGPLTFVRSFPTAPTVFRHLELGIRIEQSAGDFFLVNEGQVDPKLKLQSGAPSTTLRTFCCCRDGDVVSTCTLGLWSVSGRADGPKSGRSNIGFNVRIADREVALSIWNRLSERLIARPPSPINEDLVKFLAAADCFDVRSPVVAILGPEVSSAVAVGVRQLQQVYPSLLNKTALVWAPTVEGVGTYPALDATLRVAQLPLWVAGDSTGQFRGLTAAMVSGYYCGLQALQLEGERNGSS